MEHALSLLKMEARLEKGKVHYYLAQGLGGQIAMNERIGQPIHIRYTGEIHCIHCGKKTSKSFGQGYCYTCFTTAPETSDCVLRPELCRAHEGISRNMDWSRDHCLQDHFVYLALTSDVKVGVTRSSQIPTRWIDQGAWKAARIAKTPNRYLAGLIEVELKKHLPDKTNWRHMLTDKRGDTQELLRKLQEVPSQLSEELKSYVYDDLEITEIEYPVESYPLKVNSINLEKQPEIQGKLIGIRGQYLILSDSQVINIRSHQGYQVILTF